MIFKHIGMNIALVVAFVCIISNECQAMPYATNNGYVSYPARSGIDYYVPYAEGRLSRLRRGYYYVGGDGYVTRVASPVIAPVALERRDLGVRRFDNNDNAAGQPVQKPKRKKLFVPNLYG